MEMYQISEKVAIEIDELCRSKNHLKHKYKLVDQIVDSAVSIGSNIAEGFGRYHYRENINFLYYSRGSLDETVRRLRHFYLMKDVTEQEYQSLIDQLRTLHVKINNSIASTRRQLKK